MLIRHLSWCINSSLRLHLQQLICIVSLGRGLKVSISDQIRNQVWIRIAPRRCWPPVWSSFLRLFPPPLDRFLVLYICYWRLKAGCARFLLAHLRSLKHSTSNPGPLCFRCGLDVGSSKLFTEAIFYSCPNLSLLVHRNTCGMHPYKEILG